jgi:hypothetical protein
VYVVPFLLQVDLLLLFQRLSKLGMMKKITGLFLAILVVFFSACDVVEPPYTTENEGPGPGDDVVQKILLEDYTGHDCVNCPTAAEEAHDLMGIYDDQLIIIAVHAGWFARPIDEEPALSEYYGTEAGEEWYNYFQAFANPIGMVNRVPSSPGNFLVEWADWGSTIAGMVDNEPGAMMTIENVFNESTRRLETTITTEFLVAQSDAINLVVCVTQDSIIDGQKNNDINVGEIPLIEDYVFMHMLRDNLNGTWGENVSDGEPIELGTAYEKTYSVTFPEEWIPEHCHVVAFVCYEEARTIIQVEEAHVTE